MGLPVFLHFSQFEQSIAPVPVFISSKMVPMALDSGSSRHPAAKGVGLAKGER